MAKQFKGKIDLDIRDSTPDWEPFLAQRAPEGAPNVLVVLYDDTGCAAWSPYGGRIEMPTLQRLADDGLTYSQWHTTALCSPTRSVFLTGRNHHQNGFASISETSTGFPGYNSHIPPENASMATVLRDAGWSTFWVGKNHNMPVDAWTMGSSKKLWPLGTRLRPLLRVHRRRDQPVVSRPGRGQPLHRPAVPARGRLPPLEGPGRQGARVHPRLEAVGARQALVHVVLPGREPRAAPRAAGVHRQVQGQVRRRLRGLPRVGAAADDRARDPARGHGADADQPDDAGHVQRGRLGPAVGHAVGRREAPVQPHGRGLRRLLGVHRRPGRADRRLPRGVGTAREHAHPLLRRQRRVGRGQPERLGQREQVLQRLAGHHRGQPAADRQARRAGWLQPLPDRLGGRVLDAVPDVQALLLPGRRRRPAGDPLAEGHRRRAARCATSTTTAPTSSRRSSTAAASRCPTSSAASSRRRCPASRCATRSTPPTRRRSKETQYYEMLGTRGIWHKGWKAVAEHGPVPLGRGKFDQDRWQLFHTDEDRSEAHDLAEQHPEKLKELVDLWLEEAKKYDVLPLNDLGDLRVPRARVRRPRAGRAAGTPTTPARPRSPRRRRRTRSACRSRSSPRSSSPATRRA